MQNLSMIAAVSADFGLGKDNDLLWRFPADQKFFRQTTLGHPVVMGGKTYRSLGKPLPGRENIVLSRQQIADPNVKSFSNLAELKNYLQSLPGEKFIIGGAALYREFLPLANKIYLTEVNATKPADVFFPEFDHNNYIAKVLAEHEQDGIKFRMIEYQRKQIDQHDQYEVDHE